VRNFLGFAFGIALLAGGSATGGCLDMSPTIVASDAATLPAGDGGAEGGAVPSQDQSASYGGIAVTNDCIACIVATAAPGPGCRDVVDACFKVPKCETLVACATAANCIVPGTQDDAIVCAIDCSDTAMVSDFADPAVNAAESVLNCAYGGACKSACAR
jgi:hypothetical protein